MEQKPPVDDYVIYADDDPDDRDFLTISFEKFATNKELISVRTGVELLEYLALNMYTKGLPCLIVLDQNMPGLLGDQILELLRTDERYAEIPIVMFSTSNHFRHAVLQQYNVEYVIKPSVYKEWEMIAVKLLKHCKQFKGEQ